MLLKYSSLLNIYVGVVLFIKTDWCFYEAFLQECRLVKSYLVTVRSRPFCELNVFFLKNVGCYVGNLFKMAQKNILQNVDSLLMSKNTQEEDVPIRESANRI